MKAVSGSVTVIAEAGKRMDNNLETNHLYDDAITIDVRGYVDRCLQTLFKNFLLVVLIVLLTAEVTIIAGGLLYTPEYTGFVTYVIEKTGDDSADADVVESLGISLQETFDASGLHAMLDEQFTEKPEWLNEKLIEAEYEEETNIITLNVKTDNYYRTDSLLRALEQVYPDYASSLYGAIFFTEINEKAPENEADNPFSIWKFLAIGFALGILAAIIWTMICASLHRTINDADYMENLCNMSCLEELPLVAMRKNEKQEFFSDSKEKSSYRQMMRSLRHKVDKDMDQIRGQVLMVTSSIIGEGKSFTAAELALAMTRSGKKTVLVECDFYHPTLAETLHLQEKTTLVDYLRGQVPLDDLIRTMGELQIIPAGSQAELEMNQDMVMRFQNLISTLKNQYNRVIIDAPSIMNLVYVDMIQECSDALLYVVRYDYASAHHVESAISSLKGEDVHILGYVFNGVEHIMRGYGGYGYYRYGYQKYGYGSYGTDD